ncbi:MAG: VWA domain-containing protein [Planctomycetes bacterium]|nr:VWA domain-containing protein [Planctomycetota bacterium]
MPLERAARALVLGAVLLLGWAALLALGAGFRSAPGRPALRVVLLDASASVTRGRIDGRRALREALLEEVEHARTEGQDLAVVRVQDHAEVTIPPMAPEALAARLLRPGSRDELLGASADDGATDLAAGLRLAEALLEEGERRPPGAVVVLGDGLGTGAEDPRRAGARLRLAGQRVEVRQVGLGARPDASVVALHAPTRVPEGVGLVAEVVVEARAACPGGSVELELLRGAETVTLRQPLPALRAGQRSVHSFEVEPPGRASWSLQARVRIEGDAFHENDRRVVTGVVDGRPLVALIEGEPGQASEVARALAAAGLEVRQGRPEDLVPLDPAVTAVVSVEVPVAALPAPDLERLLARGGLWLHLGRSAAWAGLAATEPLGLAALLPLLPAPPPLGPRDVVLAVDGSGSMTGEPWGQVRAAVGALAGGLSASDGLEVRLFTTRLDEPVLAAAPGEGAALATGLARLLETRVPRGATDIPQVLEELASARAQAERRALCVLLSDGHSSHGSSVLSPALRDALSAQRADLAVVAVESGGRRAARGALRQLLREGETLWEGGDLAGLAALLEELVNAEHLLAAGAVRVGREEGATWSGLLEAWGRRAGLAHGGARRLAARGEAAPLLVEDGGAPLLGLRRAGAGWVAAAAFDGGEPGALGLLELWPELVLSLGASGAVAEGLRLDRSGPGPPVLRGASPGEPVVARIVRAGVRDLLGQLGPEEVLARWTLVPRLGDPGGPLAVEAPVPVGEDALLELWQGDAVLLRELMPRSVPAELQRPPWPPLEGGSGEAAPREGAGRAPRVLVLIALALLGLAGWARPGSGGRRGAQTGGSVGSGAPARGARGRGPQAGSALAPMPTSERPGPVAERSSRP